MRPRRHRQAVALARVSAPRPGGWSFR
jgi:hypothetical protein